MSIIQTLENESFVPKLRDFEIAYDYQTLLEKAQYYQIDISKEKLHFSVNLEKLEQLHNVFSSQLDEQSIQALFILIATWPAQLSPNQFSEYINRSITAWLETIHDGLEPIAIIQVISCIELTSHQCNESHWQLFLTDLVSETIFSYQSFQIRYLLDYDPITNLPNTNLLLDDIANKTENANHDLTLFCIRFLIERGSVTVSPIVPSTLNLEVLNVIDNCIPSPAKVYQNGNLLFSALIEKDLNDTQLNLCAVKIQHAFEQIIDIEHQAFIVSPVMCAIRNVNSTISPETYYNQSRTALRHALNNNKSFVIHNQDIDLAEEVQKKIDLEVTAAFNNEELELYLQPIVGLPSEQVVGAEVLLRWPNAKTKGIYPNVVVEIINKVGLGKHFTRWLIHSVSRLAAEIKLEHHLNIYLTLNLRAEDLYDTELPHLLIQSCHFWHITPDDIVLEITENGILEENETTLSVIKQITDYGFKLALDDFGTGYSSMARLRTLPISIIKIDQSFVKQMNTSKNDCNMVESMYSLAKSLGKDVLVEGLENKDSLLLVNQIGIPKAQGYYFAKPKSFDDFIEWAKNNLSS